MDGQDTRGAFAKGGLIGAARSSENRVGRGRQSGDKRRLINEIVLRSAHGVFFCAGTAGFMGVAWACGWGDAASGVAIAMAIRRHCPATV
ncbi:hypothetical protein ABH991_001079 [Bradyrhizobium ottawaense]|uniref:Uncharacterized protein n=1 Tax=Bradyrhizobium ottawaense TaxID=931866 RepID=A0ABV4FQD9_9BRAD